MDPSKSGAPGRTRTCGPRLRRPVLYPTELRARTSMSLSRAGLMHRVGLRWHRPKVCPCQYTGVVDRLLEPVSRAAKRSATPHMRRYTAAVPELTMYLPTTFRVVWGALPLIALTASPAAAQELAGSFDQLRVLLKPGDTIRVTDGAGQEARGTIAALTSTSPELLVGGNRRNFLESDVRTIRHRRSDPLGNGAWPFSMVVLAPASGLVSTR
jgi:hypothetical protein